MNVNLNINNKMNAQNANGLTVNGAEKKRANGNIDGRNLQERFTNDDAIAFKRKTARRQAMKLVSDAYGRDEKLAQGIRDLAKERSDKVSEKRQYEKMIEDVEGQMALVRDKYGLDPDSEEVKDYELLEKYQNNIKGAAHDSFTKEEIERLKELKDKPRTEYQVEMLTWNNMRSTLQADLAQLDRDIQGITQGITDARSEQEKSQDMIKSKQASDKIMEAAEKDILGMLWEDGKKNIDETSKEKEEEAEKAKEKKEEEEERLEKAKERREEGEELIEKARERREEEEEIVANQMENDLAEQNLVIKNKAVDHMDEAQKAVAKILKDNNLLNEDLKGIDIDLNF